MSRSKRLSGVANAAPLAHVFASSPYSSRCISKTAGFIRWCFPRRRADGAPGPGWPPARRRMGGSRRSGPARREAREFQFPGPGFHVYSPGICKSSLLLPDRMKQLTFLAPVVLSLIAAIGPESAVLASTAADAADFELKNPHDKEACYGLSRGRITVRTSGDRKGAGRIQGWFRLLWEKCRDRVDPQGAAALPSTRIEYPGREGQVSGACGFSQGAASLCVIDRSNAVICTTVDPAGRSRPREVFRRMHPWTRQEEPRLRPCGASGVSDGSF